MEIKIDLLKKRDKSILIILLGIFVILIAFFFIIVRYIEYQSLRLFDWLYFVVLIFNGISAVIGGYGYTLERIVGKAYIKVDGEQLAFKPYASKKEIVLLWKDINKIIYKSNMFIFSDSNNELYDLKLSNLAYKEVMKIKDAIYTIAREKGLQINGSK